MGVGARLLIYIVASAALVVGTAAYMLSEQEHDHEDEGLIEGDAVKVAVVGGVLAVVAIISFAYLAKRPPEEAG